MKVTGRGRPVARKPAPEAAAAGGSQRGVPTASPPTVGGGLTSPAVAWRAPLAGAARAAGRAGAAGHAALLACYLAAGGLVTWPRATYLAGRLPALRDTGGYVWGFWWVARQVTHFGNPWSTRYLAAPVGTMLAFHTLMPLPGLIMTPVTLAFGPSASYNLLAIACPGLLCYVMYRAAALWLARMDAVVAGALFGLSANLAWRSWYEVNLALGALFLPMALEAAVRLRRESSRRRGLILGAVLGAAMLTDQESAVLAAIVAGLALAPWLVRRPGWTGLRAAGLAVVTGAVLAAPQFAAMFSQLAASSMSVPQHILARNYDGSGAGLLQMIAPGPRLAGHGLGFLTSSYYRGRPSMIVVGYGAVLTALAVTGLMVAWRRAAARWLGLLLASATLLALGSRPWLLGRGYLPLAQRWGGVPVSELMPYTWFVSLPGLSGFREADRFAELGLLAAALLAGAAVGWLRARPRGRPVLAVALVLAALEAGWAGNAAPHYPIGVMPTTMPAVDGPIAADHSGSVVVDVPFGIRGGLPVAGSAFPSQTMVLATADGHPLADAFISRIPNATLAGIRREPFYAALMKVQAGWKLPAPAALAVARRSALAMHIGWVVVWGRQPVDSFLLATGFRFRYQADGAWVWRAQAAPAPRPVTPHGFP